MRAVRVAVMLVALSAAIGCGFSEDRRQAEQLAEQYFARIRGGDIAGVLSLYSARFFEVTPRASWLAFLEKQKTECGIPNRHSLLTWNVVNAFGTNAGTTTTLVYDVQYSNCRVSEKVIVFKPSGGQMQIQGHYLTPAAGVQNNKENSRATLST
jgi:hypothetical protein